MEDTFELYMENATGLASNQIWSNVEEPPPAIFIFKENNGLYTIAINPTIHGTGSKIKNYESCLSLKNRKPIIKKRDKNVTIEYMDLDGNMNKEKHTLLVARTIQHEYDHLLGKLI